MADQGKAEANNSTISYTCVKFKKSTYSPSEYSELIGNTSAAKKLAASKL